MTLLDAASDRAVLVALYAATDGANWEKNDKWLSQSPIGKWYGVITDDSGRVTYLNLAQNQLTGPIPSELGNLSNLHELSLYRNQLVGEVPTGISGLSDLVVLSLEFNRLTGPIPPELGNLANLLWLGLSGNQLVGEIPPELGGLANLGHLALDLNQLTGEIPPELGELANLRSMALAGNRLSGPIPQEIGALTHLVDLDLHDNRFSGKIPARLGDVTNLQSLFLSGNVLTGQIPRELGNIANLLFLGMKDNRLTGCIPEELLAHINDFPDLDLPFCDEPAGGYMAAERAVLTAPLQGPRVDRNWVDNKNWLSDAPVEEWSGVVIDSSQRVVSLRLWGNQLTGPDSDRGGQPQQTASLVPRQKPVDRADTLRAGSLGRSEIPRPQR